MTQTKVIILVSVILATTLFVIFGIREVKKNEKKSFGDSNNTREAEDQPEKTEFTLEEIVTEINK